MQTDRARQVEYALTPLVRGLSRVRSWLGTPEARLLLEGGTMKALPGQPTALLKLAGLGSISIMAPAIRAYAEAMRPATTTFITLAENRPLVDLLDLGAEVLYMDSGTLGQALRGGYGIWRQLRARRPAAFVDLEFYSRACTLLALATGIPTRLAFAEAPWRSHLVTHQLPWTPRHHLAEVTQRALSLLCGQPLSCDERMPFRPEALGAPPLTAEPGSKLVCVNVNAGVLCLERRLPRAHFARLLSDLAAARPVTLAFIGGPNERAYVQAAIDQLPPAVNCHNLAGRTTLPELLALLRSADLMITNDTGPLHLAVGLGTPTMAFFGPEDPDRFGPRLGRHTLVWGRAACSPCFTERNLKTAPCRGANACLTDLDPAALGAIAVEALANPPASPRIVRVDGPSLEG